MADLFDVKVGGVGWHLTSHLIALAALFVACFAITGYISFRDDTVPGSALKDHDADLKALVADSLQLESGGKITYDGATTTEIDGDLTSKTTVTKYELVDGSVIKYRVALSLNGLVASATDNDIIGATAGAASTIVNLPTNFVLSSGQIRNSVATGETSVYNLVISSTDNQAEDTAMDTDGTSLTLFEDLNGNSVSTNFEPFRTVPLEAAPSTMRFLYLTNSGTGNSATTAGELVIDLVGYINNNSITTAFAGPLARPFTTPVVTLAAAATLSPSDSGSMISISGGAYTVTLPTNAAAYAGVYYKFVVNTAPGGAITVAAGSAIIFGKVAEAEVDTGDDAPGSAANTGVSNVIFGTTCHPGDFIDFVSDGTKWYINGLVESDGAITTS